jgi:hypothetical protein
MNELNDERINRTEYINLDGGLAKASSDGNGYA